MGYVALQGGKAHKHVHGDQVAAAQSTANINRLIIIVLCVSSFVTTSVLRSEQLRTSSLEKGHSWSTKHFLDRIDSTVRSSYDLALTDYSSS